MASLHSSVVAHVKVDGVHGGRAKLKRARSHLGQFAGAAGSQQQPRSFGGKGQRSSRANAGAGAGNEDDLSLKAHSPILPNRMNMGA